MACIHSEREAGFQGASRGTCQYYCDSAKTSLCTEPGTRTAPANAELTTTYGSQEGSRLRFCRLKGKAKAPWRMGPWTYHGSWP